MFRVSIITPTTGKHFLKDNIESVRAQTYSNKEHIVVVDGYERWEEADPILKEIGFPSRSGNEHVCVLPYPTGIGRYNGHRVYGAATYFADGNYHLWLDDDNMIEPNHVESMVNLIMEKDLHWAFSFRKIIDKDGNFLCEDNCESLGLWPSVLHPEDYFIDVNCYMVHKALAVNISPVWYRKFREPGQPEIDRVIAGTLMSTKNNLKFDSTREYTVKYRVGNTSLSVQHEFFEKGNKTMLEKYNGKLPWKN